MPMDDERYRSFDAFLLVHQSKAVPVGRPVAHMQFFDAAMPHDAPLLLMDEEDLIGGSDPVLDRDAPLVRELLTQLRTYDCHYQRVVGLIFDRRTVHSHVLEMPASWTGSR